MTNETTPDYNGILLQISTNLTNAVNTFGPQSPQYQAILEILQDCLRRIDSDGERSFGSSRVGVDPDMLSVAMGLLDIGGK